MSHEDFCRMTFEEFEAVYNAYVTQRNIDFKGEWERMRLLATIAIQPHLKKGADITPQKLIPLPWDGEHDEHVPKLTPEEQRKRGEELMKRYMENKKRK